MQSIGQGQRTNRSHVKVKPGSNLRGIVSTNVHRPATKNPPESTAKQSKPLATSLGRTSLTWDIEELAAGCKGMERSFEPDFDMAEYDPALLARMTKNLLGLLAEHRGEYDLKTNKNGGYKELRAAWKDAQKGELRAILLAILALSSHLQKTFGISLKEAARLA